MSPGSTNSLASRLLARIGDIEVWQIPEIVIPTSVRWLLPDASRQVVEEAKTWLRPYFMDENGYLLQSIHTYLLKSAGAAILIDTGVGNHKRRGGGIPAFDMLDTPFLDRLAAAGVLPEDVDLVLCTHMHTDHVGWNARLVGEHWAPTFPNARHLFARPEYDYFSAQVEDQAGARQPFDSAQGRLWQDSIAPVVEAGLVDVVEPDHVISAEVRLEPSFGHTPGHVSVRIDSGRRSAVFIGDAMHSPLQVRLPEVRCALGGPEEPSKLARLDILERYADSETVVFGAHFAAPCGGYIRRDGGGYRFESIR